MIELNTPANPREPERTIVIFGSPRGGTTMVAGVTRILGLHIGDDLPGNLEDPAFRKPYAKQRFDAGIAKGDDGHRVWGWKFPRAANYLPLMHKDLRNPYYICIFRDHVAASARKIKRGVNVLERLERTHLIFEQNLKFLKACQRPALLLSYEKSIASPEAMVRALQSFLVLGGEDEVQRACEFVKPGGYQRPIHSDAKGTDDDDYDDDDN